MSTNKERSTGDLYDTALHLRACADAWEPGARLLGNIRADDLAALARDYLRLRLRAGISEAEPAKDWHTCEACGQPVMEEGP